MNKYLFVCLFSVFLLPGVVFSAPISVEVASFKPDKSDPKDWYTVQFRIEATKSTLQDGFVGTAATMVSPVERTTKDEKKKTIIKEFKIRRAMSPFQITYRVSTDGMLVDVPLIIPGK